MARPAPMGVCPACHIERTAMHEHEEPGDIRPVPALISESGFRLLVLREFREPGQPPSLAWIQQYVLRDVHRVQRHGIFFGCTFLPEIMQWMSELLGRPSLHPPDYPASRAYRNPAWPSLLWHQENRSWDAGIQTIEWYADIVFADQASFEAFMARWQDRLTGAEPPAAAPLRSTTQRDDR